MRKMERGPCPPSLDGPDSLGGKERVKAEAHFGAGGAAGDFTFAAYKAPDVRRALQQLFGGKCAYCESRYAATQPEDVEHYRPKSAYAEGKKLHKRGYWWLAAEWSNLLPSCIDCNRARKQELVGGDTVVAGKANQFPLAPDSARADQPGEEAHEKPLLLDPTNDDPLEHLEFTEDGLVLARRTDGMDSPRGAATVEVCALQRRGLVDERQAVAMRVLACIQRVQETMADIADLAQAQGVSEEYRAVQTVKLRTRLKANLHRLTAYAKPDQEYSALAEELIRAFRASAGI